MTFRGFLVFYDPPKADAQRTIHDLNRLGIRSSDHGDNRYVTAHLRSCRLDATSMLTGEKLVKLKDEALWHLAPRTDLFVEIDPQQKERIVRALQRTDTRRYLGDASTMRRPACSRCRVSVEEAVDVARESADIILLTAIWTCCVGCGGRPADLRNTLKYISITTSANFGTWSACAGDATAAVLAARRQADPAEQLLSTCRLSRYPATMSMRIEFTPQRWNIKNPKFISCSA